VAQGEYTFKPIAQQSLKLEEGEYKVTAQLVISLADGCLLGTWAPRVWKLGVVKEDYKIRIESAEFDDVRDLMSALELLQDLADTDLLQCLDDWQEVSLDEEE